MTTKNLPEVSGRSLEPAPRSGPNPSQLDRVVVLYYGKDGSRAGFEYTDIREATIEKRVDVERRPWPGRVVPVDQEFELTVVAGGQTAMLQATEGEP